MAYLSTKTYGHNTGLSACFRQYAAESHCKYLHGYALSFKLIFGCTHLDDKNWAMDFGSLKPVKAFLEKTFDHKTLVAEKDPYREELEELDEIGLAQVVVVPNVGCEAFAKYVFDWIQNHLMLTGVSPRVWVHSVECREHEGNSAIYEKDYEETQNAK